MLVSSREKKKKKIQTNSARCALICSCSLQQNTVAGIYPHSGEMEKEMEGESERKGLVSNWIFNVLSRKFT